MNTVSDRKTRRKWLPFRLRVPIPWMGPRISRHRKQNFATANVSISDCIVSKSGRRTALVPTGSAPCGNKVAVKPASDVVAGAVARAVSQSTIHPLDTLKVRMQAGRGATPLVGLSKIGQLVPPAGAGSIVAAGRNVLGLYKGVVGAASGAGIAIGAYFAFYGVASNVISTNTDLPAAGVAFVSGAVAAAGSSVVKVPLAVCIRSVQAGVYPNVFAAASDIVRRAGSRGLFTGYVPTLLEDVPDMAFKFAVYETMRGIHRRIFNQRSATPQEDFAIGAFAGSLAAAATTPLDVVKTKMMCAAASRPSMLAAAASVHANGGARAFFTGIGPRALSNGINSAVFFCFFEAIRGVLAPPEAAAQAECLAELPGYKDDSCEGSTSRKVQGNFIITVKPLLPDVTVTEESG